MKAAQQFASDNNAGICPQALKERGWRFYIFPEAGGARFMCSWDTDTDIAMVDRFADDIEAILTGQDGR